ncbi:protein MRG2-like [Apium graveolens]|uniref:protein MRG2-like n=1 Tax=Apium graveolens TaxID=4045 RepID=UPI003D799EB5
MGRSNSGVSGDSLTNSLYLEGEKVLAFMVASGIRPSLLGSRVLPASSGILKMFNEFRVNEDEELRETIPEILKGLCNYFNKALSTKLLYKTELQQYDEVRAKNIQPSTIYGAEHFCVFLECYVSILEWMHLDITQTSMRDDL